MKIILERYYGDWRTTKALMRVESEEGRVLLRCEAREPRYAQYTEAFHGCSRCCLAEGVFGLKVVATELSPMTLTVVKSPGHRCCRIGYDDVAQVKANRVLVGESDGYDLPEYRDLVNQEETFRRLESLVYAAYVRGEAMTLEVTNLVLLRTLSSDPSPVEGEGRPCGEVRNER